MRFFLHHVTNYHKSEKKVNSSFLLFEGPPKSLSMSMKELEENGMVGLYSLVVAADTAKFGCFSTFADGTQVSYDWLPLYSAYTEIEKALTNLFGQMV